MTAWRAAGARSRSCNGQRLCQALEVSCQAWLAVNSLAARAILRVLQASPGQGVRQLARSTGFGVTAVRYALVRLEADGMIRKTQRSGRFAYTLTGRAPMVRVPPHLEVLAGMLVRVGTLSAVAAVRDCPGTPAVTTRHRLNQLVRHGLARQQRRGRTLLYRPTPSLQRAPQR